MARKTKGQLQPMPIELDVIYNKSSQWMTELPDGSIDMVITSPPYWGLRNYGDDVAEDWDNWHGQLGLEPTFQLYLDHMMIVCEETKRVLKKTGSFWLNMGDTYGGSGGAGGDYNTGGLREGQPKYKQARIGYQKCLLGIPWRLVLRLIDEQGWILRNAGIWNKPNSMPSSTKDRLSNSYEFLFHFVKNTKPQYYWNEKTGLMADRKPPKDKQKEGIDWDYQTVGIVNENTFNVRVRDGDTERFLQGATDEEKKKYGKPKLKKRTYWHSLGYWYDLDAIREAHAKSSIVRISQNNGHPKFDGNKKRGHPLGADTLNPLQFVHPSGKNPGDVWVINTQPRPEAHFATFPDKLCIKPILATCPTEICKKCGKARVRITKRESIARNDIYKGSKFQNEAKNYSHKRLQMMVKAGRAAGLPHDNPLPPIETIGWTDCGCNAGWDSGILLDPFAGRGTSLIMAKKLGRHYVGYELKREYADMAERELEEIDPLFRRKNEKD